MECNQQFFDRRGHQVKERLRIEAYPEDEDQQRDSGDNLAPAQVAQGIPVLLDLFHDGAFRAKENLLEHISNRDLTAALNEFNKVKNDLDEMQKQELLTQIIAFHYDDKDFVFFQKDQAPP